MTNLCSCLNVKETFPQDRRKTLNLSDYNGVRKHNHLVYKQTLNHLVKVVTFEILVIKTP